jgi:hypothetical protein
MAGLEQQPPETPLMKLLSRVYLGPELTDAYYSAQNQERQIKADGDVAFTNLGAGQLDERTAAGVRAIYMTIVYLGFALAVFNTIVHGIVCLLFLFRSHRIKWMWPRIVPGRAFESPGSGLKYLLSVAALEWWAACQYLGSTDKGAVRSLYTVQIFVTCGVGAYDQLVLARPGPQLFQHMMQSSMLDIVLVSALYLDEAVDITIPDVLKVYAGFRIGGCLWGAAVVFVLRAVGLLRLPLLHPDARRAPTHRDAKAEKDA